MLVALLVNEFDTNQILPHALLPTEVIFGIE